MLTGFKNKINFFYILSQSISIKSKIRNSAMFYVFWCLFLYLYMINVHVIPNDGNGALSSAMLCKCSV